MIRLTADRGRPVFVGADNEPMSYADGLKQLRKGRGWSNVGPVAAITGVSPRTVEGWEQGRHEPSKSALMLLAAALK
jgi:transcriptional regulator with XRE-family HTH domain